MLCSQLKEAKFIAEESDKKYEEVGLSERKISLY